MWWNFKEFIKYRIKEHQYPAGTSFSAPQSITKKPMEVYYLDEVNYNYTAYCWFPTIQQYFNTSITVLTNQVWKLLIELFKVPNTGAFTVQDLILIQIKVS